MKIILIFDSIRNLFFKTKALNQVASSKFQTIRKILNFGGTLEDDGLLFKLKFYPFNNRTILKLNLRDNTSDLFVLDQIYFHEEYKYLLSLVDAKIDLNIVDGGANIGCTSLWLANYFPNSKIISIEADKDNFNVLISNIKLNQKEKQIQCFHNALWTNNDELRLSKEFRDGSNYSYSVLPELKSNYSSVYGITMDEVKNYFSLKCIDILKLDIEGSEKYLFEDIELASKVLQNVLILALEIHDEVADKSKILENLNKLSYSTILINETYFFKKLK